MPTAIGTASGGQAANTAGTTTITPPSGALWYLAVLLGDPSLMTTPSGWTRIYNSPGGFAAAYTAPASSSPSSSWVSTSTDGWSISMAGYDRVASVAQTVDEAGQPVSPTASPSGPALVARIYFGGGDHTVLPTLGYPPSATLGQVQSCILTTTSGSGRVTGIAHEVAAVSGSVGTATWTVAHADTGNPSATFILTGA